MILKLNKWLLPLGALFLFSQYSFALPEDSQQEIQITSDSASLDKTQGLIIYTGNVKMVQGTLKIQADKITLTRNKQGLKKVEASGQPAHYEQVISVEEGKTHASGNTIIYHAASEELVLIDNAELEKQGNLFSGDKIVYLINEQRIKADSKVIMVIQPKQEQDK
jgi:lipopolysaccharide export system protein LptA